MKNRLAFSFCPPNFKPSNHFHFAQQLHRYPALLSLFAVTLSTKTSWFHFGGRCRLGVMLVPCLYVVIALPEIIMSVYLLAFLGSSFSLLPSRSLSFVMRA